MFESYTGFDSNDFSIRKNMDNYKHTQKRPYMVKETPTFEYTARYWYHFLLRAQAYFVASQTGLHKFHLACKTRCQFDLSDVGFDIKNEGEDVILSKTVGGDIGLQNYDS